MKLALGLMLVGLALFAFSIMFMTIGGPCRVESCGPSINALAGLAAIAFLVLAVVAVIRRPRPR
jgi:hypothetical protein